MINAFELLRDTHNVQIHVASAGAGAGIAQLLWSVPGSSAYFSGATVLNAKEETVAFLGYEPSSYASEEAAIGLALAAYQKAYVPGSAKFPVGLGIAASVATLEVHKGAHRIHAALIMKGRALAFSMEVEKGTGYVPRTRDGAAADQMGLALLCHALEVGCADLRDVKDVSAKARESLLTRPYFTALGERLSREAGVADKPILYQGAFNPLHFGHVGGKRAIERAVGTDVVFTTTVNPPHKPELSVTDMLERAKGMRGHAFLLTENDPLYLDKARAFPGHGFAIGMDAALRMMDPKWGPDPSGMIQEFCQLGTRFYVFDRKVDGKVLTYEDLRLALPSNFREHNYVFLPMNKSWDVSSTELRHSSG